MNFLHIGFGQQMNELSLNILKCHCTSEGESCVATPNLVRYFRVCPMLLR